MNQSYRALKAKALFVFGFAIFSIFSNFVIHSLEATTIKLIWYGSLCAGGVKLYFLITLLNADIASSTHFLQPISFKVIPGSVEGQVREQPGCPAVAIQELVEMRKLCAYSRNHGFEQKGDHRAQVDNIHFRSPI